MIIVSSHRPHSRSEAYRINQVRAKKSWDAFARKIVYFGLNEPELQTSEKTFFVGTDDFPRIMDMASFAGSQSDVVAIVNADIVLTKPILEMERRILRKQVYGAISRRYHYDPTTADLTMAKDDPADRGRDIFIALPRVWAQIALKIPSGYRIGHQKWDAWVSDYFRDNFGKKFYDFTGLRCVFHPIHEERTMPYAREIEKL